MQSSREPNRPRRRRLSTRIGRSLLLAVCLTCSRRRIATTGSSARCWCCYIGRILRFNRLRRRIAYGDTRSAPRRLGVPGSRRRRNAEQRSRPTAPRAPRPSPWSVRRSCTSGGLTVGLAKSTRAVHGTVPMRCATGSCGGPGMSGTARPATGMTRSSGAVSGKGSRSCSIPRRSWGCSDSPSSVTAGWPGARRLPPRRFRAGEIRATIRCRSSFTSSDPALTATRWRSMAHRGVLLEVVASRDGEPLTRSLPPDRVRSPDSGGAVYVRAARRRRNPAHLGTPAGANLGSRGPAARGVHRSDSRSDPE